MQTSNQRKQQKRKPDFPTLEDASWNASSVKGKRRNFVAVDGKTQGECECNHKLKSEIQLVKNREDIYPLTQPFTYIGGSLRLVAGEGSRV